MNILDTLAGVVEKHPDLSEERHSELLNTATDMYGHAGAQVLSPTPSHKGLGHVVGS